MVDVARDERVDGVVIRITNHQVQLISRLGRVLTFSPTSFSLLWTRLHAPCIVANCDTTDCRGQPIGRFLRDGSWTWTCHEHLPPTGQPIVFPFDSDALPETEAALSTCPVCQTPTRGRGSGATRVEGTAHTLFHCGTCRSQWFFVVARGTPEDGLALSEAIGSLSEQLSGNTVSIRAYAGRSAYQAIERAIGRSATRVLGTPLNIDDRFGANNLVVVGDSPTRNVQRLGGTVVTSTRHGYVYMAGEPEHVGMMPVRSQIELTGAQVDVRPAPGTVWWANNPPRNLVRVVAVEDGMVRFSTEADGPAIGLDVREFMAAYSITAFKAEDTGRVVRAPLAGETWWAHKDDEPVLVTSVGQDDSGFPVVEYRMTVQPHCICDQDVTSLTCPAHRPLVNFKTDLPTFLKTYGLTRVEVLCQVGEEWAGRESQLLLVQDVRVDRREVVCVDRDGHRWVLSFRQFAQDYRKVERKTCYELLNEEDPFDD